MKTPVSAFGFSVLKTVTTPSNTVVGPRAAGYGSYTTLLIQAIGEKAVTFEVVRIEKDEVYWPSCWLIFSVGVSSELGPGNITC